MIASPGATVSPGDCRQLTAFLGHFAGWKDQARKQSCRDFS
jgi:hypothetical protein